MHLCKEETLLRELSVEQELVLMLTESKKIIFDFLDFQHTLLVFGKKTPFDFFNFFTKMINKISGSRTIRVVLASEYH